jgi:hypothetical protein
MSERKYTKPTDKDLLGEYTSFWAKSGDYAENADKFLELAKKNQKAYDALICELAVKHEREWIEHRIEEKVVQKTLNMSACGEWEEKHKANEKLDKELKGLYDRIAEICPKDCD